LPIEAQIIKRINERSFILLIVILLTQVQISIVLQKEYELKKQPKRQTAEAWNTCTERVVMAAKL
jgi:hypothetical protein